MRRSFLRLIVLLLVGLAGSSLVASAQTAGFTFAPNNPAPGWQAPVPAETTTECVTEPASGVVSVTL